MPVGITIASCVAKAVASYVAKQILQEGRRSVDAWRKLDAQMPKVSRAWNKVRAELEAVGLLYEPEDDEDSGYLEQIELEVAAFVPSCGEAGYFFDAGVGWLHSIAGYEEGIIYLPSDLPDEAYVPGGTLTDVIRHEYAHAWYWVDPDFVDDDWFKIAFGASYLDESAPVDHFAQRLEESPKFVRSWNKCRNERECDALWTRELEQVFISDYASTKYYEDFAETFMYYLKYRNNLDRFKSRKGVYRKLKAVEKAVQRARKELGV